MRSFGWHGGSGWRGQSAEDREAWDREHSRQRWVYMEVELGNDLATPTDPVEAYRAHRASYERTGDPQELAMMLDYVGALPDAR